MSSVPDEQPTLDPTAPSSPTDPASPPATAPTPQPAPAPELEPQEASAPPAPPATQEPQSALPPADATAPKKFNIRDATPEQRREWGRRGAAAAKAKREAKAAAESAPSPTSSTLVAPTAAKLNLTAPEDRTARAMIAATSRWGDRALSDQEWQQMPMPEAEAHLAAMRLAIERISRILQQRYQIDRNMDVSCTQCRTAIPAGRWAQMKHERDPSTGLVRPIYLCSERCIKRHHDTQTPALPGPPKGDPKAPSQYAPPAATGAK